MAGTAWFRVSGPVSRARRTSALKTMGTLVQTPTFIRGGSSLQTPRSWWQKLTFYSESPYTESVVCVCLKAWYAHLLIFFSKHFSFPQTKLSERENQYVLRKIQINNAENTMKSLLSDVEELAERVGIQCLGVPSEKGFSRGEPG